jgi:hypothetical protein
MVTGELSPEGRLEARRLVLMYAERLCSRRSRVGTLLLSSDQSVPLRDMASSMFRFRYNGGQHGSMRGLAVYRLALEELESESAIGWCSDGVPVAPPVLLNQGHMPVSVGSPQYLCSTSPASAYVACAWRSLLLAAGVHRICEYTCLFLFCFPELLLDGYNIARSNTHLHGVQFPGLAPDAYWGCLLHLYLCGRLRGPVCKVFRASCQPVRGWVEDAAQWLVLHQDRLPRADYACYYEVQSLVDAEYLPFCLKGVPCFVENPYGTLRLCKFMLCLAEYLQVCSVTVASALRFSACRVM